MNILMMNKQTWKWVGAVLLGLMLALTAVFPAFAHTRVEVGEYAIVVGWETEPVIVGERNAITVEIRRLANETAVVGAEGSLNVEVLYADASRRLNLNPTDEPGLYAVETFPTVRGQYTVRLFGELEGAAIDEMIEPEEVGTAARLQFPEPLPDTLALEERIAQLEGQLQTSRLISYGGVALAAIGSILGALGLRRKGS